MNIYLRPIEAGDADRIVEWRNNLKVRCNLYSRDLMTLEQHHHWVESQIKTLKCKQYIIVDALKEQAVGSAFFKNIDLYSRKAEFGIFIGEDYARGKGFGTEATIAMLDIGFYELRLNRIWLSVFANNVAAIKSYIKAGFVLEGRLRQDYFKDNEYQDIHVMAILRRDFDKAKVHE